LAQEVEQEPMVELEGSLLNDNASKCVGPESQVFLHKGGRRQCKRRIWLATEEEALRQAVAQIGMSQWAAMLVDPRFGEVFAGRTNVDLKGAQE
jgi:hypothetical protein